MKLIRWNNLSHSITPQQYFLRYAFPCAYVLCDLGKLEKSVHERLKDVAINNKDISFDELEKYFPEAFRRMSIVSKKKNLPVHSIELIKEYFLVDHADFIDAGDGTYGKMPKSFCEFCKVKKKVVLDKKIVDNKLFVQTDKDVWSYAPFFKENEIKKGTKVTVHHALAVEILL